MLVVVIRNCITRWGLETDKSKHVLMIIIMTVSGGSEGRCDARWTRNTLIKPSVESGGIRGGSKELCVTKWTLSVSGGSEGWPNARRTINQTKCTKRRHSRK